MTQETRDKSKRAIVAAVQLPSVSDFEFDASLTELRQLAKTLGFEVVGTFTQKRASFDSLGYMGTGKREEMRRFVHNEPEPAAPSQEAWAPRETDGDDEALEADGDAGSDSGAGPDGAADAKGGRRKGARGKAAERESSDPDTWRADLMLVDNEISPTQTRNLEKEIGIEVMENSPSSSPPCRAMSSALNATARTPGRNRLRSCQSVARETSCPRAWAVRRACRRQ